MSIGHETSVFDPRGDFLLLVEITNEVPAYGVTVGQASAAHNLNSESAIDESTIDESVPVESTIDESTIDESAPAEPPNEPTTNHAPTEEAPTDHVSTEHRAAVEASGHTDIDGVNLSVTTARQEVVLRVSSKHLALASKVFLDMFDSTSKHRSSGDKDLLSIRLGEDAYDGLQILLNIVDGLTRCVPRKIDLKTFLHTAVLIDQFEFEEVAEVFTDMWFDFLQPQIPRGLNEDLGPWIFICEVLKKRHDHKILTKIAIWETSYGLEDTSGRVPDRTISKIANKLLQKSQKIQKIPGVGRFWHDYRQQTER